jgi:hypothetical protein
MIAAAKIRTVRGDGMSNSLMSNSLRSVLACGAAAIVTGIAAGSPARAASPDFCRDYATAAVRQVQLARSIPACDRGTGPRWTTDFRVHFDWCLNSPPGAVEAERNARTNWLRACRGM